jgi:hypothetical protein
MTLNDEMRLSIVKTLTPVMAVCVVSMLCGWGTTLRNGANSNTSRFEGYPSYEIDRPINEQIQVVAPIGNGTM